MKNENRSEKLWAAAGGVRFLGIQTEGGTVFNYFETSA